MENLLINLLSGGDKPAVGKCEDDQTPSPDAESDTELGSNDSSSLTDNPKEGQFIKGVMKITYLQPMEDTIDVK